MKKILLAFLLICTLGLAAPVAAKEINVLFQWGQNISQDFGGWKLLMSEAEGGPYTPFAQIPFVSEQTSYSTGQMVVSPEGQTKSWFFVLTAFDLLGSDSGFSNEVELVVDFEPPDDPFSLSVTIISSGP